MKVIFYRGSRESLEFSKEGVHPLVTDINQIERPKRHDYYWMILYPDCEKRRGLGVAYLRKTWGKTNWHNEHKEKSKILWPYSDGARSRLVMNHHAHSKHAKADCEIRLDKCAVIEVESDLVVVGPIENLNVENSTCEKDPDAPEEFKAILNPCKEIGADHHIDRDVLNNFARMFRGRDNA